MPFILGLPKAAIVTHERFIRAGSMFGALADCTSEDIIYTALPLYHTAAIAIAMGAPLQTGIWHPRRFTKKKVQQKFFKKIKWFRENLISV